MENPLHGNQRLHEPVQPKPLIALGGQRRRNCPQEAERTYCTWVLRLTRLIAVEGGVVPTGTRHNEVKSRKQGRKML